MVVCRRRKADRRLAKAFCQNARAFHGMAHDHRDLFSRGSAYHLAITIELGLKAYLLHRGFTDQWNREHLRHDLVKTLKCVRRAGLKDIPEGIRELTIVLGPPYASGALSRRLTDPILPLPPDATDLAISDLLATVEAVVGQR